MLENTGSKIGLAFTILGGVGGVVAVAQWADLNDHWRFGVIGFILGAVPALIVMIFALDSPYRREKLAREQKKLDLVQQLPSRTERLEELRLELESRDLELSNARIDLEEQAKSTQSMFENAPEWLKQSNSSVIEKKKNELFMLEQAFKRAAREEDRVSKLTDTQWRQEQAEKIYVPD